MACMNSALLVIDVQHGLFGGAPDLMGPPFEAEAVIARINSLVARARSAGAPVVWVQHQRAEGFLAQGSASWQLQPDLHAQGTDTRVFKTTPDSFLRTDLAEHLARWGTQRLVVCGYATEFCIDTTSRRALALGWPVTLAADAHTTHDKPHLSGAQIRQHHNITLPDISSFGPRATAVPAAQVVF